ncbi:MAG: inorganic diphosphatase, partial [Pseudomonadales bacterium]
KYEVDKNSGALFVDRFMTASMFYPCAYGYVPYSLSEDGDPLDVLVHTPYRVLSGCVIRSKPIGILKMEDEAGLDAKVLAVPVASLIPAYASIHEVADMPETIVNQIEHFFQHYKDLEKDKWVKIIGWGDSAEARTEIAKAIAAAAQ